MADNYLERKMEEYQARPSAAKTTHANLERLLRRNRSHRGYDARFLVRPDQLRRIIAVNCLTPSARNQQVLRFRPVLHDEAHKVAPLIRMGGALPHLHLPFPGSEPNAYIVICSTTEESRDVDIDLGIAAQSMLLQAVEMGLNGLCIGAFDREKLRTELSLPHEPLLVLAIGRGKEHIELKPIAADESHTYYREEDVHYVPKLRLEELLIQ